MWKVIRYFTDMKDGDHPYSAGDTFPREGMRVDKARLEELSGSWNKQMRPLIEYVDDRPTEGDGQNEEAGKEDVHDESVKAHTRREISRMSVAELRSLAGENGLDEPDGMIGSELKAWLIEKLGL